VLLTPSMSLNDVVERASRDLTRPRLRNIFAQLVHGRDDVRDLWVERRGGGFVDGESIMVGGVLSDNDAVIEVIGDLGADRIVHTLEIDRSDLTIATIAARIQARMSINVSDDPVALSKRLGVLGDRTSFLVLESDAMWTEVERNRQEDRRIAMEALRELGLGRDNQRDNQSGSIASVFGPPVNNVFGPGGLGAGINNALGGLRGVSIGSTSGSFGGLGSRGTGLGIGGLGGARGTRVSVEAPEIDGPRSREAIRRVIARHMSQARYCFEKQVLAHPELHGKIIIDFDIAASGSVPRSVIATSTLTDGGDAVEACVTRVFSRLRFESIRSGRQVNVRYPMTFHNDGGGVVEAPPEPTLEDIRARRLANMLDTSLIDEEARALARLGRNDEAARLRSEIAELAQP